jgi:hypothetical protein
MTGALTLVALFVIAVAFGRWVQGRAAATRKLVFRSTWIVLGAPVALFVLANVISSDSLAMIAGLSLMALLSVAVPLGLGVLVGTILAGRSRQRDGGLPLSAQSAPSPPVNDTPVSPPAPQGTPTFPSGA